MKASKWMYNVVFALATVLFLPLGLMANNIRIIGTPEVVKNNDKTTAAINFTLAWDNSWKSSKPLNHDAAWIFVKCWDGDQWNHVYLEETGHTAGLKDSPKYRVYNRTKANKKMPMAIEIGKSVVYKKWHVDPAETPVTGVVGVFLYRKDSLGSGDIVVPGISLKWNYVNQGFVEDDDLVVKVFAVEMVYVPKGAFYLGGKGTASWQVGSFTTDKAVFGTPMYVTSESAITIDTTTAATTLWSQAGLEKGSLPDTFPKGFQAFYIMKYELTQEAYADFLNTLNQGQQDGRIQATLANIGNGGNIWNGNADGFGWHRYYIEVSSRAPVVTFGCDANANNNWNQKIKIAKQIEGEDVDSCDLNIDGQDIAMPFTSMYDLLAYADFAGLRPMTELEYEKACRGDRPVVNNEYAWGSVTKTHFYNAFNNGTSWYNWTTHLIGQNRGDEVVAASYNSGAASSGGDAQAESRWVVWSWWYNWRWEWRWRNTYYSAPLRVGCFADSTSDRASAGATYWGVMNMSDNCSELCISVGSQVKSEGRKFGGVHGDGQLLANGNADVDGWNISSDPSYYIPRGMVFPSTGGWSAWSDWSPSSSNPGTQAVVASLESGMISSRHKYNHAIAGTTREEITFMPGIRCVRTAAALK